MKKIISTSEAPGAIGPYSQAVRSGSFLFCSGQIPLDPKSGQIVPGDIAAQTRRVLDNIAAVLKAEGLTFDNVVKTTIFLTNLGDFQTVNEIYGSYFKQDPPARSTVQVAALPKGANVEIEVIAIADEGGSTAQVAYDTSGEATRRRFADRPQQMSEDLLALFRKTGALLDGHFILRSGLHSRQYFQCALLLQDTEIAAKVCGWLADQAARIRLRHGDLPCPRRNHCGPGSRSLVR